MKALDTYKPLVPHAAALVAAGYGAVGSYLFQSSAFKHLLTAGDAKALSAAGLKLFTVWENGQPTTPGYFTQDRAKFDAEHAISRLAQCGQPKGSILFFAVDADIDPSVSTPYLETIHGIVKAAGWLIGAYGSGAACQAALNAGVIHAGWLSQSTGFPGFQAFKPHAAIVQGPVTQIVGIDCDSDTVQDVSVLWSI